MTRWDSFRRSIKGSKTTKTGDRSAEEIVWVVADGGQLHARSLRVSAMDGQNERPRGWVMGKLFGLGAGLRHALGSLKGCFVRSPYREMDPDQELDWDYLQVPDMSASRTLQGGQQL